METKNGHHTMDFWLKVGYERLLNKFRGIQDTYNSDYHHSSLIIHLPCYKDSQRLLIHSDGRNPYLFVQE